jgi:hypothetical protein
MTASGARAWRLKGNDEKPLATGARSSAAFCRERPITDQSVVSIGRRRVSSFRGAAVSQVSEGWRDRLAPVLRFGQPHKSLSWAMATLPTNASIHFHGVRFLAPSPAPEHIHAL